MPLCFPRGPALSHRRLSASLVVGLELEGQLLQLPSEIADGQPRQSSVWNWRTSCSDCRARSPMVRFGSILLPLVLKMATLFWPPSSDGR